MPLSWQARLRREAQSNAACATDSLPGRQDACATDSLLTPIRAIRVRAATPKELSPLLLTPHSSLLTPHSSLL
ncbi:hypothetical protein [Egbenema bharatensis]|uniref:hypothetical protein n=1 Tax=Egbenema bharatensis TaxID=3463334 RepID=UPI003A85C4B2